MLSDSRLDRRTRRLCGVIVLGAFATGLDVSVVNVGLADIGADLGAPLSQTQWVATAYLLALALSLPVAGWLARRHGTGVIWLNALAAFTVASALCALAPGIGLLIAARVLQGLAGGVLIPAGQTILGQAVGPERLGRVMGALGIVVGAAPALGPFVGGLILTGLSWHWLFVINLPIGVVGVVLGRRMIPHGVATPAVRLHRSGVILATAGLPLVMFGMTQWGDAGKLTPTVGAALAAGVVILVAFVVVSRRAENPLMDLSLYGVRGFRVGSVAALFSGALVFGSGLVFTLYFQLARDLDALATGLNLLGAALATAVCAPFTGRWIDRYGPGPVALAGGFLAMVGSGALTVLPTTAPLVVVQPLLVVFGAAVSLTAMPAGVAAYKAVRTDQLPDGVTQVNVLQRVGGSFGGAIFAVLIATRVADPQNAFQVAFGALLVVSGCAAVAGWYLMRATATRRADP
ncbi:DHA2 family efflux MFS transporter permease subunit [Gordonia sp. i37]|uniref:DHA2 family efflux MFS transporter permease subunit n=1 Tax=Gordonia sp. i37 TaxID=1961707 RepID=UPI00209A8DBF|nr:DHA2 family efflux MFS transporter permease subunit [Gordonia sp. i37]